MGPMGPSIVTSAHQPPDAGRSLVIVDDLDLVSAGIGPTEANAILVVNADAALTLPIAFQRLQAIPRREPQAS